VGKIAGIAAAAAEEHLDAALLQAGELPHRVEKAELTGPAVLESIIGSVLLVGITFILFVSGTSLQVGCAGISYALEGDRLVCLRPMSFESGFPFQRFEPAHTRNWCHVCVRFSLLAFIPTLNVLSSFCGAGVFRQQNRPVRRWEL
jgi:hypothetical protein